MSNPLLNKHAQELRDTWQARCLAESRGKLAAVVLVVLFANYRDAMKVLLRVLYPGFRDIKPPFFSGYATIMPSGKVTCDIVNRSGITIKNALVYDSEAELVREFRTLAERLKLSDDDRVAMTEAIKRWVVADLRVNHMGELVA